MSCCKKVPWEDFSRVLDQELNSFWFLVFPCENDFQNHIYSLNTKHEIDILGALGIRGFKNNLLISIVQWTAMSSKLSMWVHFFQRNTKTCIGQYLRLLPCV